MADARDPRGTYAELRRRADELAAARAAVARADAATARLDALRAAATRTTDPREAAASAALTDLAAESERAAADATDVRGKLRETADALRRAMDEHERLSDPTVAVTSLDGQVPLLLMPLRIETRFKGTELWVRAYPDEWALDTFEPELTADEVESARRFWASWWRAGGDEGMRRAAWRAVVASHGSGRAGWVVGNHQPLNPVGEPARTSADDVVLVVRVVGDDEPTEAHAAAAAAYWTSVWREQGDTGGSALAALAAAVGGQAAADAVAARPPFDLGDGSGAVPRADATVAVALCRFAEVGDGDIRASSWTAAPRARVLPDRLVLVGLQGGAEALRQVGAAIPPDLALGPDPSAGPDEQFRLVDGELVVPDDLRWMVDFDEAVRVGMGFRVLLDAATAGGFDRLLAMGVRVGAAPEHDQAALEDLLTHHLHSRRGLALVRQGTPTNNTEAAAAGLSRLDDPDETYPLWFGTGGGGAGQPGQADWAVKQDGQWLAEGLGIDPATLAHVAGAAGTDHAEAIAMGTALWPATWGYYLDTMMHPLLDDGTIERARSFFLDYVSGRGLLPALRIGRQPYGILPTTALSRLQLPAGDDGDARFLTGLQGLLMRMSDAWQPLADGVAHLHATGDPPQALLDIVGLHPTSVELHQRYAESVEDIVNRLDFGGLGGALARMWETFGITAGGRQLLRELGYSGGADPDILGKVFHGAQHALLGPLVDDRPLSESAVVRAYCDDGRDYLAWLVDAASSSLDELRRQLGFSGDQPPTALLYLLIRQSLLLSWWDAGLRFRLRAGELDEARLQAIRRAPAFLHVGPIGASESRWATLYGAAPAVTGSADASLADAIPALLGESPARHLGDVIAAVKALTGLPTARLERLLAEHLDCASYRLDAWLLGLVHHRLLDMRIGSRAKPQQPRRGIHLGAFGWLVDVRPESRALDPVELPEELAGAFPAVPSGEPLLTDSANGGFVHAPSLNHATTAAILRSGYLANASPAHPDAMAVNISSERMRLATSILQGLRNGQSLGALLGYRFERGLHDRHALAEVDALIHPLRIALPSAGDRDGRLPLDGLALVRQMRDTGVVTYPFGHPELPAVTSAQATAVDAEAARLLDIHDAVADLVLAESVHQAVLGNYDRVAGTLDAIGQSGFPTDPAVLLTPHPGAVVTHRVGVHLRAGLDHAVSPVAGLAMTPRAMAEPAVNELLAALLPPPAEVVAQVSWPGPDGQPGGSRVVSQADLGLQPIDLLHVLRLESESALGELDERILWLVRHDAGLGAGVTPVAALTERVAGKTSFFELAPLVGHLRAVLTRSRPLRPTDVAVPSEAASDVDAAAMSADRARVDAVRAAVGAQRGAADALVLALDALLADAGAHHDDLVTGADGFVAGTVQVLMDADRLGFPGSGSGEIAVRVDALAGDLRAALGDVATRWRAKLADADAHLAADDAVPSGAPDTDRIRLLLLAERAVSTALTDPVPTDATAFRTTVEGERGAFAAKLGAIEAARASGTTLSQLLHAVDALLPLDALDPQPFDVSPFAARLVDLCGFLRSRAASSRDEAASRGAAADAQLTASDAAAPGAPRVDLLTAAVRTMLGDDALFVPELSLPAAQAAEWSAAMAWSRTGGLTAHLAPARSFPVDDWMHGIARVREKIWHWEQATLLAGALGRGEPDLWPVQLPHLSEPWAALELPPAATVAGERLLYTAHYASAFDPSARQCGLLIDEWTESIPGDTATTGISFQYDRPDSEPPQAMLLVVPPVPGKGWQWDDIVAALHETLDLARLRAVEPDQLATTPFAGFLPATVASATVRGLDISVNYAVNNDVLRLLRVDDA
ncbi:MAG: hypothetical protein ACJ74O_16590 [Frankiaceae bacterium]